MLKRLLSRPFAPLKSNSTRTFPYQQTLQFTTTPVTMGVQKTIITEGSGPNPQPGQTIKMHYTGWLKDPSAPNGRGKKFDSSVDRNEVFVIPIGVGQLIKGWDQGVPQMKVGEKALLDITSDFAYGARGAGDGLIPGNADLIFEVELLGLQ